MPRNAPRPSATNSTPGSPATGNCVRTRAKSLTTNTPVNWNEAPATTDSIGPGWATECQPRWHHNTSAANVNPGDRGGGLLLRSSQTRRGIPRERLRGGFHRAVEEFEVGGRGQGIFSIFRGDHE